MRGRASERATRSDEEYEHLFVIFKFGWARQSERDDSEQMR